MTELNTFEHWIHNELNKIKEKKEKKTIKDIKKKNKLKNYSFLIVFNKNGIELFKFNMQNENFIDKKNKIKNRFLKKWITPIDLSLVIWENKKLLEESTKRKITQRDIDLLIEVIKATISWQKTPDDAKKTILELKEELNVHPIFVFLLNNWFSILEILQRLDFDFKTEFIEIVWNKSISPYEMFKKLEFIWKFKEKIDLINKKIQSQFSAIFWYLLMTSWLILWVKFWLFRLLKTKLWAYWLDVDKMIWFSSQLITYYFYFLIWILIFVVFLIIARITSKPLYNKIIYSIPWLWKVFEYWNTIKLLIIFSFYSNNIIEFRKKIYDSLLKWNFNIKENKESEIDKVINKYIYDVKKKHNINVFFQLWIIWLSELKMWWNEILNKVVENKIEYISQLIDQEQEKFEKILWWVSKFVIWTAVWITAIWILQISFGAIWAMK